jgi:AraC-like DNA-binding protein
MDTISPVYARIVLRELERRHIASEPLFAGSNLSREQLLGGGDIPLNDFLQILRLGHQLSGDDRLGLMIGSYSSIATLGEVGAALAIAPSVRAGLQVLESYNRLHISYISLHADSNASGLSLQLSIHEKLGSTLRFHLESAAMLLQHYVETLNGQILDNALYQLAIPQPDYWHSYADYLHSPIAFNTPISTIELPGDCLDNPSPYYDADMWQRMQLQLSAQLAALAEAQQEPYARHLAGLLNSCALPLPDLPAVAATLCMTERTLNRRLKEENASFRDLKSAALLHRAQRYLEDTQYSVEAIAADLGYQDTANFRRAFRKRAGCSPAEYRRGAQPSATGSA